MKKLVIGCVAGALLLCGTAARAQQRVILSWISKKAVGAPISVNGPTQVEIVVSGVNDILYSYEGSITATPLQLPSLGGGGGGTGPKLACPAQDLVNTIKKNWDSWQVNPLVDENGKKSRQVVHPTVYRCKPRRHFTRRILRLFTKKRSPSQESERATDGQISPQSTTTGRND